MINPKSSKTFYFVAKIFWWDKPNFRMDIFAKFK